MIYLASQSPRRRELLEQIGVAHRVIAPIVDETPLPAEPAETYVRRMAMSKARAVVTEKPESAVLGSDTAVVLQDRILGKPGNKAEGLDMLRTLSGRTHRVLTGVALITPAGSEYRLSDSLVRFRAITEAELQAYWETGEPADKAGAYAIQGLGAMFIEHLSGSYSGVMGLPLFETAELLTQAGHGPLVDVESVN